MIGKIKGQLVERFGNKGLIETSGGVFYEVFLPAFFYSLPLPSAVEIYTYLQVREDALTLYGFESKSQLDLFNMLHSVSGVGPKTAFTIVSFIELDKLQDALKQNDLTKQAYKKWITRSDNPCPLCKEMAAQPPIPFKQAFAEVGDIISATYEQDGKTKVLKQTVGFEDALAGNLHVNCACIYQLIIE